MTTDDIKALADGYDRLAAKYRAINPRLAEVEVFEGTGVALRQWAEEREHFEWLEKQSGNLFTPMQGEGWAWYGNDGRSYTGSTLGELIAAATRAEAARLAEEKLHV